MTKILLSYRRSDSTDLAGRLVDRLTSQYGPGSVLFNIDEMAGGFRSELEKATEDCDVVLVLIGPRWRGVKQGKQSAIDNEFDPIRLEVELALRARKTIVPILIHGARMPAPQDLPESLRELSFRNSMELDSGQDFHDHIGRLTRAIDNSMAVKKHVRALEDVKAKTSEDITTLVGAASPGSSARIVLSYRRSDSSGIAGRVFDRMRNRFGRDAVYMDIDSIPYGTNFRTHIEGALQQCKVLVALLGPKWFGPRFFFRPRIFDRSDPVRIEVETALRMNIPIMPVLLDATKMPNAAQLPMELRELCNTNAAPLDSGRDFDHHVDRLLNSLTEFVDR